MVARTLVATVVLVLAIVRRSARRGRFIRWMALLAWIPRFLELFTEIKRTRPLLEKINVSTVFYQSYHDELVPRSAVKYIKERENVKLNILKNSTHFYYDDADMNSMIFDFKNLF